MPDRATPWGRIFTVVLTACAVLTPIGLVLYQSVLDAPFFQPSAKLSTSAFRFVLADSDFHRALGTTALVAAGMAVISVPLGSAIAFLLVRTDLPGRRWLEPLVLVPIFLSPVVLGFGYVVSMARSGSSRSWPGRPSARFPGTSTRSRASSSIAGLTHVPHVYLYTSSALRCLGSDVEEAARWPARAGHASRGRSACRWCGRRIRLQRRARLLPRLRALRPAADPRRPGRAPRPVHLPVQAHEQARRAVLSAHGGRGGGASWPSPSRWSWLQRRLLRTAGAVVTVGGKGAGHAPCPSGGWRWVGLRPSSRLAASRPSSCRSPGSSCARSSRPGARASSSQRCSRSTTSARCSTHRTLLRGILNTGADGVVGGGLAVACYTARWAWRRTAWRSRWARFVDYLVMVPRGRARAARGPGVPLGVPVRSRRCAPLRTTL